MAKNATKTNSRKSPAQTSLKQHKGEKIALAAIAVAVIAGALLYSTLPDKIASHWNSDGVADGIAEKELVVIGFPLLMIVALLALSIAPRVKELKPEIQLLHKEYSNFKAAVLVFLAYVYLVILVSNTDFAPLHVSASQLIFPGISILLYYIATILPRLKRNHLVGIRTPWTVQSDAVWEATHRLGAKMFKALAVVVMIATLTAAQVATALIIVPILAVGFFLVIYSYDKFQKLEMKGAKGKRRKAKPQK